MSLRARRASVRRARRRPVPARRGRGIYTVDLSLDARLLGRFRLLSIEAAIDVAEPVDRSVPVPALEPRHRSGRSTSHPLLAGTARPTSAHRSNGAAPHRRADAEVLLGDAERSLGATPAPPRP